MHCVHSEFLLNSGNFPETAWRAIHSRQAAPIAAHIAVFLGAAPSGESLDRQATQSLGYSGCFCMNRLAGLVVSVRRRGFDTRFKLFLSIWRELLGGKSRGGS